MPIAWSASQPLGLEPERLNRADIAYGAEMMADEARQVKIKTFIRKTLVFLTISFVASALSCAASIYISLSPKFNESVYRPVLFHPGKMSPYFKDFAKYNLPEPEAVSFRTADGTRLTGWFFKSIPERRVVVLSHGQGGDMTWTLPFLKSFLDLKTSVLVYNYRGYGDSEGTPSIDGICEDGVGAFDFLANERKVDPNKIIVAGVSLGTGVAAHTSQARHAAGLILQSGYASLKQKADEIAPFARIFPSFLYPKNALDNADIVSRTSTPLLVLHGAHDSIFPLVHAQTVFERAHGPKQIYIFQHGTHHNIAGLVPEYSKALSNFFESLN